MRDKLFLIIVLTAFLLRVIGLTPNFAQHPDEPGVIEPSNKILLNIIYSRNPDPNVQPHPFKYASAIFYMHALIRGIFLSTIYITYKITGYSFSQPAEQFSSVNYLDFIKETGPYLFSNALLWIHRFPSVLFGTATVILVYYVALALIKKRSIALLSALSLAVMPHHVRDSHWATVTIIQTFFFLLAFYLSAKVWRQPNLKNCILAGISVGFATSIKYFPLSLLPLAFFLFLSRKKLKHETLIATIVAMPVGYFIGMPYVFYNFHEMVEAYKLSVNFYAPDQTVNQSLIQRILPSYVHGYHLAFLFKDGIGPILTSIGIFGIFYGFVRWRLITTSLLIIPIVNLIFISFYLEAIYQTLIFPGLPFFAIFVGLGCLKLINYLTKKPYIKNMGVVFVLSIVLMPPFINSSKASLACTQSNTELQASDWIAANIPNGAVLAYQPGMRLPSKDFKFIRSEAKENFLLSEVQELGAEYIALHSGLTDRYPLWADDNIFFPSYIKENEFTRLVMEEFRQNAPLMQSFVRPTMCVNSRIYIYKIPIPFPPAQTTIVNFQFNKPDVLYGWKLGKTGVPSGTTVELLSVNNEKVIRYSYSPKEFSQQINNTFIGEIKGLPFSFYGTPFLSPFITVDQGKRYSATLAAKRVTVPINQLPDGFLRLDFYAKKSRKPILTRFSPRLKIKNNDWQNVTITTQSPTGAKFATIAFQTSIATESSEYLIKQITFFGE